MSKSRPMTVAVSQRGIELGEAKEGRVRTMKADVPRSLSAVGSRKAPNRVF